MKKATRTWILFGIALLILIVLAFVLVWPIVGIGDRSNGRVRARLTLLSHLINEWEAETGNYPAEIADIQQLLPSDTSELTRDNLLMDTWGNKFLYRPASTEIGCEFDLYSAGPNGRDDGRRDDDIDIDSSGKRSGCGE